MRDRFMDEANRHANTLRVNSIFAHKKSPAINYEALIIDAWQCPTLTWGDPTLPSAMCRFTSEFEMGSGGTNTLLPPGKLVGFKKIKFFKSEFWNCN